MTRAVVFIAILLVLSTLGGCGSTDPPGERSAGLPAVAASQTPRQSLPIAPGLEGRKTFVPLADVVAAVDPQRDKGWETESLSEAALGQLKKLGKLLAHPNDRRAAQLQPFVATNFRCVTLRPETVEVFRDQALVVLRAPSPRSGAEASGGEQGGQALERAIDALSAAYGDPEKAQVRTEFKMVRVELNGDAARTLVYFQAAGTIPDGIVQQSATWNCHWSRDAAGALPKLTSIEVEQYEEVRPRGGANGTPRRMFADCTEAIMGHTDGYKQQLVYGADHWSNNFEVAFGVHQGNQGLAIGDVNGDGLDDVYLCQPAGLPNRLFVQQIDGSLKDVSTDAGVDWLDMSRSALLVDLDNDGDQDLVVVVRWSLIVHENDGQGKFAVRRMIDTNANLMALSAADYDQDGDLDLYVCGYSPGPETGAADVFANPVPYHDANNGAKNFLLRNDGGLDFTDVTVQVGLDQNNRKFSYAAAWEDYDNDGDLDLYVANDFGRKNLYRNDKGRFIDVAAEAGVEDIGAGMSVSFGDYDHDGRMDLYVGNMFSSAGNRIAFQPQFSPGTDAATRGHLRRHARGNSLFRNLGNGRFEDVSVEAGVTMGRWAWGSLFTDINNDGWEDLHVVNGFFTSDDTGDL